MLYVFQVDTGQMLTFDMNLALDSVTALQQTIHTHYGIAPSSQVLLVSGGAPLQSAVATTTPSQQTTPPGNNPNHQPIIIGSFPSGTDTSPIFLFNKQNIENSSSPVALPWVPLGEEYSQIEEDNQQASYGLLSSRSQKGVDILRASKDILGRCESLIHDQHLQHLGWGAVVANLEDIVGVFKGVVLGGLEKVCNGSANGTEDLKGLDLELIEGLPETLQILSTLPVPYSLINGEDIGDIPSSGDPSPDPSTTSLLSYLTNNASSQEQSSPLYDLPTQYTSTFDLLNPPGQGTTPLQSLLQDSKSLLQKASAPQMRQIKGLSHRLQSLDTLLESLKKLIKEQGELSQSLVTTTTRARELSDKSILPDLCSSHYQQLVVMTNNLQKIQDIHRRCLKTKEELINNLNLRLKWVIDVQKKISENNQKINVYMEAVKKFKCLKNIIKQVSSCHGVYIKCLQEVLRRKKFEEKYNEEFLKFKEKLESVFTKEVEKRRKFNTSYSSHFVFGSMFGDNLSQVPEKVFQEMKTGFSVREQDVIELFPGILEGNCDQPIFEKEDVEKVRDDCEERVKKIEEEFQVSLERIREELMGKYEKEIVELKESHRAELEGVKARVKFVQQQQQIQMVGLGQCKTVIGGQSPGIGFPENCGNPGGGCGPTDQQQQEEVGGVDMSSSVVENVNETGIEDNENCENDSIPDALISVLTRLQQQKAFQSNSFKIGSPCIIYYSSKYEAFVLYNSKSNCSSPSKSSFIHFVHTENAKEMDKDYCYLGSIVDKEYCVARRAKNRYKVPEGFHFYRVRVVLGEKVLM